MASPLHPDDLQGRKFPPVGRCIYCGSDGGVNGLQDEHIIPLSLGGNSILQKASCSNCAKATSYIEGYLARNTYYDIRLQMGIKSRRKKHQTKRTTRIALKDGVRDVELDLKDSPNFINLPVWERPGLMYADQPSPEFREVAFANFCDLPPSAIEKLGLPKSGRARIEHRFNYNLEAFSRAIAKIAYCSLVAIVGIDNIRPLFTPAIILGRYPYPSYFVGCHSTTLTPRSLSGRRHAISYGLWQHGKLRLAFVHVRLFADCGTQQTGMPIYEALVGSPKAGALPFLRGDVRPVLP